MRGQSEAEMIWCSLGVCVDIRMFEETGTVGRVSDIQEHVVLKREVLRGSWSQGVQGGFCEHWGIRNASFRERDQGSWYHKQSSKRTVPRRIWVCPLWQIILLECQGGGQYWDALYTMQNQDI